LRLTPLLFLLFVPGVMMAQPPGTFTSTGSMTSPRSMHSATLLLNGKVLIAGGYRPERPGEVELNSAELYDPLTGTFTATGSMTTARRLHSATLLPGGKVLIVGGYGRSNELRRAELYDPSTGTFTATGGMADDRAGSILLPNGKVLIIHAAFAELYDPASGSIAAAGAYDTRPTDYGNWLGTTSAILLPDGTVLIPQVYQANQIYDPVANTFRRSDATHWMDGFTATLLTNGNVLFAGGSFEECTGNSAGVYNPSTGIIAPVVSLNTCRMWHTATLLPDGTVLIGGSQYPNAFALGSTEVYDPTTATSTLVGDMATGRFAHTATLLADGTVLVTGGISNPYLSITSSAEVYHPAILISAPALLSLSGDGNGQGAILHAGTSRVASAGDPATAGEALEIYLSGLADGSVIPPQVAIGGRLAEILFFGRAPGFPGYNQVNFRVPSGVASGSVVPVRLTYLGRASNEVTIGVR
jgi:galactose oxidase-like protein